MVPWNMLSKDLQKTWLAMIILYGSARVCSGPGPMVCDPQPPPTLTVRPTSFATPMICDPTAPPSTRSATSVPLKTPMICDPVPPPTQTVTPTLVKTPMICDPPPRPSSPPPTVTRGPTSQHYQVRNVQTTSDQSVPGAIVKGVVRDEQNRPIQGVPLIAQGQVAYRAVTNNAGEYVVSIGEPGNYRIMVEGVQDFALPLQLKLHDVVTVEWVQVKDTSGNPLPLAEIRTVEIVWNDGWDFAAETPWPEARLHWSASGGQLFETEDGITWQPPTEPGRYLLEVVADWGYAGLAVDALTLIIEPDGSAVLS